MASRSEILQQQLEEMKKYAPPALSQQERDKIMANRKGQADIDAGRKAIADREKAISEYAAKVNDLSSQLSSAMSDEGKERTRQGREAAADPLWNTFIPSGAGAAGGAAIGEVGNRILHGFNKGNAEAVKEIANELGPVKDLTNSQINRSRMAGAASAAEKYMPSSPLRQAGNVVGRGLTYGVPAGLFYNEYSKYADRAADPTATDADKAANQRIANALLGVSTGIAADGGLRFAIPSRHPGEGEAMARINAARDYVKRVDQADDTRGLAQAVRKAAPSIIDVTAEEVTPPKQLAAPEPTVSQPASLRNADRLRQAVKATGGGGARTKEAAAQHLLSAVDNGNRAAVAKALGIANGPNLDKRVRDAITALATKPGASSLAAATLAAGLSWGGEAEAADGSTPSIASQAANAAAAGAVAGGTTYGMGRLFRALSPAATQAAGAAATGMTPGMIDDMTNYTPDEVAQGRNWIARNIPAARHLGGGFQEAYDMATVPERRPADALQEQVPPDGAPVNEFDRLVAASQEDPELADLLRQAVMARLGGEQLGPLPNAPEQQMVARRADPMAGMLRNLAVQ